MRVAVVCPIRFGVSGFVGGGTRYPEELSRALSRHVHCDFFVFGAENDEFVDPYGLRHIVRSDTTGQGPNAGAFSFDTVRRLADYEIVHFHTANRMALVGALIGRVRHQRSYLTPLGGGERTGLGHFRLDSLFSGFPLVSNYTKVECPWLVRRHSTVIYGGGDAAGFHEATLGVRRTDRVVCVGRISAHKGFDVLIKAMPNDAELVICGQVLDPEYHAYLRELARHKDVQFIPPADDAQLGDLYASAAAVVMPSLYEDFRGIRHTHPELLGLVLLEAMWHGTSVVASNLGGIPEIVAHEKNGLLVNPGDPLDLHHALVRLLEDRSLRLRLGAQGRQTVEERFTWNVVAERVLSFYGSRPDKKSDDGEGTSPVSGRPDSTPGRTA